MTPEQRALERGAMFPYDAPDTWRSFYPEEPAPLARDWAHAAARGVLADLSDRKGIKWELEMVDGDVHAEIVEALAAIIRQANGGRQMTMTPEQLREVAKWLNSDSKDEGPDIPLLSDIFYGYAAALEELARVKDALLGVKEYREKNPLGGPAKVFDAMADQIRAGDDFNRVIADYGWCPVDRAERVEAALADHERWLDEMVSDYRLDADPHTASKRLAINSLIHEQRTALAESERKCERGCFCLMEMMQAYERRVRSLCAPEEIEKRPWECAEYNKAAEYLRAVWKPDAYRAEFKEES